MYRFIAVVLVLTAFCTSSCNYKPQKGESSKKREPGSLSFFPSYAELKDARERELARELEGTFKDFSGVESVKVHVSLVDSRLGAKKEGSSQMAIVLWSQKGEEPDASRFRKVAAAASVELEPGDIEVVFNDTQEGKAERPDCKKPVFSIRLVLVFVLCICLVGALAILAVGLRRKFAKTSSEGSSEPNDS